MNYRNLGKSGLEISELSFGSWVTFGHQIEDLTSKKLLHYAYDNGINFFDNAEGYAEGKSETVMGDIIKDAGWERSTFVLSSKVFWGGKLPNQEGLSRKHIFEGCNNSLRRLKVDYLDLYYCHRPDETTPIEETVLAMSDLIHQGKVLYWGTSEWSSQQIMQAYSIAREHNLIPSTMEQPEYNMFQRFKVEKDFKRLYKEIGLGTTIWSPLASGLLTGKYNSGKIPVGSRASLESLPWLKEKILGSDKQIKKLLRLSDIAKSINITMAQLAIAWCLKNPNVSSVILGASKLEQLKENIQSGNKTDLLTTEIMEQIEEILHNKPE